MHIVIGVPDVQLMETMADVILASNSRRITIVYGDSLYYLPSTTPFKVIYTDRGEKERSVFDTENYLVILRSHQSYLWGVMSNTTIRPSVRFFWAAAKKLA